MKTKAKLAKKPRGSKTAKKPGKASAGARTKKPKGKAKAPARPALPLDAVAYQTEDTTLPIDCLTPGPNYAHRTDEGVAELGKSLCVHGVRQRLWVRALDKPAKGKTHEIIAGERRYRAAILHTQLLELPVTIYHVTQEQAYELNLIENLQREDANPIDEALGFRRLLDECGYAAWDERQPERSLGHKLGKSKTYIYAALKLCDLGKTGQEAVRRGELTPSVAVRIARIPNPEHQADALANALRCGWTDAEAAEEIADRYMTELKGAPFDREDPTLNPERPSCQACPFRSGNQAEMFPDMAAGRQDICTDPACYRTKCAASFAKRADAHEEAGGRVLTNREAGEAGLHKYGGSIGGKWVDLNTSCYSLPGKLQGKKPADLLEAELKADPAMVTLAQAIDGTGRTYEIIERDRLQKILKARGAIEEEPEGKVEGDYIREERERKRLREGLVRHQLGRIALAGEDAVNLPPSFARLLIDWLITNAGKDARQHIVESRGLDARAFKLEAQNVPERAILALRAHAASLDGHQLPGLVFELLCTPEWTREGELSERARPVLAFMEIDGEALYQEALQAIPGGQEILEERRAMATLTEPIATLLAKAPNRTLGETALLDGLEKAAAFTRFPEGFEVDGLDDWWRSAGEKDGRIEKPHYDTYRLKAAVQI